jgi:hypothetical protein
MTSFILQFALEQFYPDGMNFNPEEDNLKYWLRDYVQFVIEPDTRWVKGEPLIMKDPILAQWYAIIVIKGRWLEAEPYIKTHYSSWEIYKEAFSIIE